MSRFQGCNTLSLSLSLKILQGAALEEEDSLHRLHREMSTLQHAFSQLTVDVGAMQVCDSVDCTGLAEFVWPPLGLVLISALDSL